MQISSSTHNANITTWIRKKNMILNPFSSSLWSLSPLPRLIFIAILIHDVKRECFSGVFDTHRIVQLRSIFSALRSTEKRLKQRRELSFSSKYVFYYVLKPLDMFCHFLCCLLLWLFCWLSGQLLLSTLTRLSDGRILILMLLLYAYRLSIFPSTPLFFFGWQIKFLHLLQSIEHTESVQKRIKA